MADPSGNLTKAQAYYSKTHLGQTNQQETTRPSLIVEGLLLSEVGRDMGLYAHQVPSERDPTVSAEMRPRRMSKERPGDSIPSRSHREVLSVMQNWMLFPLRLLG